VIFDRDGVLCHFDLAAAAAFVRPLLPVPVGALLERWARWQERSGLPRTVAEEHAQWAGFSGAIAAEFGLDREAHARFARFDYTSIIRAYPDARPALASLRSRGLRTAVFSNFSLASIDASLAAAGLADLIDLACAGPVVGAMKPDPAAYAFLTGALAIDAGECLLLDDDRENVAAACAFGMRAYVVDRRRRSHALRDGVISDLTACTMLLDAAPIVCSREATGPDEEVAGVR
jgi:HAD superfamily hydrolase (TIGR01509 family)